MNMFKKLMAKVVNLISDVFHAVDETPQKGLSVYQKLGVLSLVILLYVLRCPQAFIQPEMWAEDGVVFFATAYNDGLSTLFYPYARYFQVSIRLFAWIGSLLPIELVPRAYFLSWLFVVFALVWFILSVSWLSRFEKIAFAIAIVLTPNSGETCYNLTNVHWYVSLCGIIALLCRPIETSKKFWIMVMCVVFAGLSNPIVAIISPFFFLRWFVLKRTSRYETALFVTVVLISVAQLLVFLVADNSFLPNPAVSADSSAPVVHRHIALSQWLLAFVFQPICCYFLGVSSCMKEALHTAYLFVPLAFFLLVLFMAFLRQYFWLPRKKRAIIPALLVLFYWIVFLQGLGRFGHSPESYIPFLNDRYFVVPYIILSFALIELLSMKTKISIPLSIVCAILLANVYFPFFRIPPNADTGWQASCREFRATGRAKFKANTFPTYPHPEKWIFELKRK